MLNFSKENYGEIVKKAKFINSEYEKRDIPLSPASRLIKYSECVKEISDAYNTGKLASAMSKYDYLFLINSFKEIQELHGVVNAFQDTDDPKLNSKLNIVISGSDVPNRSERKTESRDLLFELNIAAHLKVAGCPIEFVEPDILFYLNDITKLVIACKRPNSETNLKKSIRRGRRQIIEATKRGVADRGFLAISLDKIINPRYFVLEGKDIISLEDNLVREMKRFIDSYGKQFISWIHSKKVFAILYSLSTICIDKSNNLLINAQQIVLNNLCSISSPYFKLIEKVKDHLKPIVTTS